MRKRSQTYITFGCIRLGTEEASTPATTTKKGQRKTTRISGIKQSIKLVSYRDGWNTNTNTQHHAYKYKHEPQQRTEHIVIVTTLHSLEIYFVIDLAIFCHMKQSILPMAETTGNCFILHNVCNDFCFYSAGHFYFLI